MLSVIDRKYKLLRATLSGVASICLFFTLTACNPTAADNDGLSKATSGSIAGFQTGVTPHHIELISGNNQTGSNNSTLPSPIVVRAVDAFGAVVPNVGMVIQVLMGGGFVATNVLNTDANGQVSFYWTLGPAALGSSLTVTGLAIMEGNPTSVTVNATAYFDPTKPAHITISGTVNNQSALHGTALANPLSVKITDANLHVIPNTQVDWSVTGGKGSLSVASSGTDAGGVAYTLLTVGQPGIQAVNAAVHGFPLLKLTFVATSTTIPFTQIWNFTSGTTSSFTLGNNIDFSSSNVCELTPTNNFDQVVNDFSQGYGTGVVYGTLSDGTSTGLRIGNANGCDGTTTNCLELDPSWTPQYSSLVGYWKLNGDYLDSSGNGRNGTLRGTGTFSNSVYRVGSQSAGFLAGDNHSVELGSIMPTTYTKAAWINITADGGTNIISGDGGSQHAFRFSGCGTLHLSSGHNGGWGATCDPDTLQLNTWYHVAVTYDLTTQSMKLYKNGIVVSLATGVPGFNGSTVKLAGFDNGNSFSGYIDDAAIWSAVLGPNEIATLYSHQSALHAGVFVSRIFDALSSQTWPDLAWNSTRTTQQRMNGGDYASLYSASLLSSNTGFWHFDEAAGATTLTDSSGSGFNGTIGGTAGLGGTGKIGNGFIIGAPGAYIDLNSANPVVDNHFTVSTWFNGTTATNGYAITKGNDAISNSWGLSVNASGAGVAVLFMTVPVGSGPAWVVSPAISVNSWHQAVGVVDGSNKYLYIDGNLVGQATILGNFSANANPLWIGGQNHNGYNYFFSNGSIDEMAVWSRSLSALEVQQFYQMGGSRIKFQTRMCTTANCSGTTETWQGPDKTLATAYLESDGVNSGNPISPITTLTFATPSPSPAPSATPARYFQYRAIFETAAQSGGLSPELKSVRAGTIHYDPTSPSVVGVLGAKFYSLGAFADLPNSSTTCPSGITYNIGIGASANTAVWYYWNGSVGSDCTTSDAGAWCGAALGAATANSSVTVNAHLPAFPVSNPNSKVFFKAFLNSNGNATGQCQLSRIQIDGQL